MTCINGSEKIPTAPGVAWVSTSFGQDDIVSNTVNALRLQPSFYIDNVASFCASPPPPIQEFSPADLLNIPGYLAKMITNAKAAYWHSVCRCKDNPPQGDDCCDYTVTGQGSLGRASITRTFRTTAWSFNTNIYGGIPDVTVKHKPCGQTEFVFLAHTDNQEGWKQNPTVTNIGNCSPETPGSPGTTPPPPPPPVFPPTVPPPPEVEEMACLDAADKAEILAAVNDCKCDTKLDAIIATLAVLGALMAKAFTLIMAALGLSKVGAIADTAEIAKDIIDDFVDNPPPGKEPDFKKILTAIEESVPQFLRLEVNITAFPINSSLIGGGTTGEVRKLGWVVFKRGDYQTERQFICYEKQYFTCPFNGLDAEYDWHFLTGVTGSVTPEFYRQDKKGVGESGQV